MTPSGTLWLSRVHIPPCKRIPSVMLCSHCPMNDSSGCLHITVYLAVMLQASWHSERVTKGQMVHFSSHDGLQNFKPKSLPGWVQSNRSLSFSPKY